MGGRFEMGFPFFYYYYFNFIFLGEILWVPRNVNCEDLKDRYRERRKCVPQRKIVSKKWGRRRLGIRKCTAYRKDMHSLWNLMIFVLKKFKSLIAIVIGGDPFGTSL
ncbi:hypothetical protein Ddye_006151 [Dipteronia dyeriana]|uniref:Uncharacterized protein n=1 Tax=Dipteronia dyeriana TaxID=168575 RepID=A0AAD9XIH6_9ROSI|nr:hypothetical protein Ddye_006151 [Dipteronia dyeriana]